jgi:hypothetical protein
MKFVQFQLTMILIAKKRFTSHNCTFNEENFIFNVVLEYIHSPIYNTNDKICKYFDIRDIIESDNKTISCFFTKAFNKTQQTDRQTNKA